MEVPDTVTVLDSHPLIRTRLTIIRAKETTSPAFRSAIHDIGRLMVYRLTESMETVETAIKTPLKPTAGYTLKRPVVVVPILRAGLALLHGFTEILSEAAVGYVGLARNETTHQPESYYYKQPVLEDAEVIVVDPMLATGGSAIAAISELKASGATRLRFAAVIAAPEGIDALSRSHPDVPIFVAALDECLNEDAYIVPGLGDAGDRYCGT